jgi:hypothetical protein
MPNYVDVMPEYGHQWAMDAYANGINISPPKIVPCTQPDA